MDSKKVFHWGDYLVFLSVLAISFVIGVYQRFTGGRQKSTDEYLMGNRSVILFVLYIPSFVIDFISCKLIHIYKHHVCLV